MLTNSRDSTLTFHDEIANLAHCALPAARLRDEVRTELHARRRIRDGDGEPRHFEQGQICEVIAHASDRLHCEPKDIEKLPQGRVLVLHALAHPGYTELGHATFYGAR